MGAAAESSGFEEVLASCEVSKLEGLSIGMERHIGLLVEVIHATALQKRKNAG
jgi:hypothetical protein